MSQEYEIKKPQDLTRINGNDMGELLWWSYILGTNPEHLLSAIKDSGDSSETIRKNMRSAHLYPRH